LAAAVVFQFLLRRMPGVYLKIGSVPRQGFLSVFCAPVLTKKKITCYKSRALDEIHSVGFLKIDSYVFNERLLTVLLVECLDKYD